MTDDALRDLELVHRKGDPQVVRWALKKCLLLERDPEAGEELRGGLIGFRKLAVGDRDWRLIWRVTYDDVGATIVDVAEVWAFGARNDAVVYEEVTQRVAALQGDPHTVPLAEALELLGRVAHGITASGEPLVDEVPVWLRHSLVRVVGMPHSEVVRLTQDQAQAVWDEFIRAPKARREFPE